MLQTNSKNIYEFYTTFHIFLMLDFHLNETLVTPNINNHYLYIFWIIQELKSKTFTKSFIFKYPA